MSNGFEKIFKDEREKLSAAIEATVTVDTVVRLALVTAAKVLNPKEIENSFEGIREQVLSRYTGNPVAETTFSDIKKAVLGLEKEFHQGGVGG